MHANALEVALALWRMPAMRTALRQRPLPDDVGRVIELAPGAPQRIAAAAAGTDVTPAQLLEAVRFYIREVLMFDGADAYRVLGVVQGAAPAQVKAHHRALQHWLHPDRRGDDWESVYATRINTAWGDIRSPERRAAYDARNAQWPVSGSGGTALHSGLMSDWQSVRGQQTQTRWFGWVGVGLALALCLWLIVLADRQASAPAPEWVSASEEGTGPENGSTQPFLAGLVERVTARPRVSGNDADADAARSLAAAKLAEATLPPEFVAPLTNANGTPAKALAVVPTIAAAPLPPAPAAAPAAIAPIAQGTPLALAATQPVAAARKQAPVPVAPIKATAAEPAQAPHRAVIDDIDPLVERARLAHRRGDEITRYLTGQANRAPPIWRSVAAQDAAESLRMRLANGRTRIARIMSPARIGDPEWRIAAERATMVSTIERAGAEAAAGTLHVELTWRDGMWLVDTIEARNLEATNLP